jgi:cytochrome d ubiquinol oxidase subunit II
MPAEALVGLLALVALTAYAVLGGADFGGGVWDLLAGGPRKAQQRDAIARAMGPVWEANHVWLIFVIVLLFAGFPDGYAALSIGLFLPFHLVLLGIILRGAAFVFRAYSPQSARGVADPGRTWGAIFGAASVVTPLVLGMSLGAVSSGEVAVGAVASVPSARVAHETVLAPHAWHTPVAWLVGLLTLALCAYLAAVFLANETAGALREDFRRRALWSGTAVVALSVGALPVLHAEAPHLWEGLMGGRGTVAFAIGIVAALLSGWWLRTRRHRMARAASVVQVGMLLLGWGLAQYPYLIYPALTLEQAAAPRGPLLFLLWSTPVGMALLIPSLWYLFRVFKGEHLGLREE